ncbi:MAG: TRAP transporter substrate-binding protein [Burkholderiales bacterium]|nr:TRAP transporter substrate-binding protein [Burkholderiales bacterium]
MNAPRWRVRQYHYLSENSHVHPFLVDLWNEVHEATGGRVAATVIAKNQGLPGAHLDIVDLLIAGEIECYVLMGGILGGRVPALEIQGLPFAFRDHAQVHRVLDGPLGAYLQGELRAKGIHALRHGLLENGFRHISTTDRPVTGAADLEGLRIRIPEGRMFADAFASLGAVPVEVNVLKLHDALKNRKIDAQENPLAITEALKLHEVTRHVALTGHMWSGFNMMASLKFWNALPEDVRQTIEAVTHKHVARQRAHTDALNRALEGRIAAWGMQATQVDRAGFRDRLRETGFYRRWRDITGATAWKLLGDGIGPID